MKEFSKIINLGQKLWQQIIFQNLYTMLRLKNMLLIRLVFWKSEAHYTYKGYAYEENM